HIALAFWRADYNPGLCSAIVLFLPVGLLYFRFLRQHCAIGWPGISGGMLFGAAAPTAPLLYLLFFRSAPSAGAFALVALAPLFANLLYDRLHRAWRPAPQSQKT